MAEKRHVQHLRSKVVENGKPKLPLSDSLLYGELAINYANGTETLSIKNDGGNVVAFSSDAYYTEQKLGSAFTNSEMTVTEGLDSKVSNEELDSKIATAIASDSTVIDAITSVISGDGAVNAAIEEIVDDKLTAYSSATEINAALEGKSDVGHTHTASDVTDFASGVADVIVNDATVSGAINTVVSESIVENNTVKESVESVISAFTDSVLDEKYAFKEHTHEASEITDFSDAVEGVVTTSETITNRLESVVVSAITNNADIQESIANVISGSSEVSGQVASIVDDKLTAYSSATEIEAELENYAKKGEVDNVSEFINDVAYVTSGEVNPMIADAIANNEAVINAITDIISNDSGVTEAINNAVEASIEAATSGKVDNDAYTAFTASTEEALGNKADTSAMTEAIEAATSGKVNNDTYTAFTSSTEIAIGKKFEGVEYVSNDKKIYFYDNASNTGTALAYVDATDFIKDGMVESASVETLSGDTYLVITFNTDSGHENINIPIDDIFDADNYYTKNESNVNFLAISGANDYIVSSITNNVDVKQAIDGVVATAITNNETISGEIVSIIEGELSAYSSATEVNAALEGKSDVGHTHTASDVTDFATSVESVVSTSTSVSNTITSVVNSAITNNQTIQDDVIEVVSGSSVFVNLNTNVNTISGDVVNLGTAFTDHVGDTDIHVTTAEKTAWNAKSDFDGKSSGVTAMTGYEKASTYTAIAANDSLNAAIGKLEKGIEDAAGGGVTSVSLTGGTNNGTLKLTVNGTPTDNIAVTGLGGAAYLNTGTTSNTVAAGNHSHAGTYATNAFTIISAGTSTVTADTTGDTLSLSSDTFLSISATGSTNDRVVFSVNTGTSNTTVAVGNHTHSEYTNQNAFGNVKVGSSTIAADSITDTLEIATGNTFIGLTADTTNDKVTIGVNTGTTNTTVAVGNHTHNGYVGTAVTVTGASGLTGGGALSSNVTIGHATAFTATAKTSPNAAQTPSFGSTFNVPVISYDKYGHITGTTTTTVQIPSTSSTWTNNYYITGATVTTATSKVDVALTGNSTSAKASFTIPSATTSAAGVMTSADKTALNNLNPLSGKVSTLSAITATSTAINSLTGTVGSMAFQNTSSYSSATQVNTALAGKSGTGHTHASYVNQNAFSNVKVGSSTIAAETTTDTLEIASGDTFIGLTADTTNDKLTIGINTGTTNTTVAVGNHTHTSSDVTDFSTAVETVVSTSSTISGSVKTIVTNAMSTDANVSGAVETIVNSNANVTSAKSFADFCAGHNTVTSLVNLPATKRLIIANVSASQNNVSVSGGVASLPDGYEIHVMVNNTSSSTITIAATGLSTPYKVVGEDINIASNTYGEINIISDGTTLYVRGA